MSKPLIQVISRASFDIQQAQKSSERAERRYLFRVGGYALKVAKSSLRIARTIYSKPGEPPRGKTGAMRKGMAFKVLMDERSVIIGPQRDATKPNALTLHEFGGKRSVEAGYRPVPISAVRAGDIDPKYPVKPSKKRAHVRVFMPAGSHEYKPRPYMGPALKNTVDQDQTKFWAGAG